MTGAICLMVGAASALGVVFTPPVATGSSGSSPVQTNVVTVSVSAGSGYTFEWLYVSGDVSVSPTMSISGATQRWSATLNPGEDKTATWRCIASLAGNPVASGDIFVSVQRF